jgi:hypothetical protein
MKRAVLFLLFSLFVIATSAQTNLLKPDASGYRLRHMYLNLRVKKLWLNGEHVDWLTGKPDNPTATTENTTHCSAFVAAACANAGVYILRPPKHKQELLANAQYTWLNSSVGYKAGWRQISGNYFEKAQQAANKGFVVVATYKNPNPRLAGHIVCIMPTIISADSLSVDGPQVIQASRVNSSNIAFRKAFKRIIKKWPAAPVLFFYNEKKFR